MLELIARSRELSHENRRLLAETSIRIALARRVCSGWTGIRGGADLRTPPDADNTHWPLDELQRLVRDKLQRGALFLLRNERYWAGPANGIISGRLPSQQFHEHVSCTFMRDHTAVRNRLYIGPDNLMWGSDYPHQDSSFPNLVRIVSEHFVDVPISDQRKIARGNAISLYDLQLQP